MDLCGSSREYKTLQTREKRLRFKIGYIMYYKVIIFDVKIFRYIYKISKQDYRYYYYQINKPDSTNISFENTVEMDTNITHYLYTDIMAKL